MRACALQCNVMTLFGRERSHQVNILQFPKSPNKPWHYQKFSQQKEIRNHILISSIQIYKHIFCWMECQIGVISMRLLSGADMNYCAEFWDTATIFYNEINNFDHFLLRPVVLNLLISSLLLRQNWQTPSVAPPSCLPWWGNQQGLLATIETYTSRRSRTGLSS